MKNRIEKIFDLLSKDIDVILIKNSISPYIDLSFFYVTGFDKGLFENCIVLLYPDGSMEILTSELESEIAKDKKPLIFNNKSERDVLLKEKIRGKKVGLNFRCITHRDYLFIKEIAGEKISDVGDSIKQSRLIKDEVELKYIKKACMISSNLANQIPSLLKEKLTEREIAAEISHYIFKKNASLAFRPIVAFGYNSSQPHYSYGRKKISEGFALLDFGAKYRRYCSDISRTFYYGKPSNKMKKIYDTVLDAQKKAFTIMKPDVKGSVVHDAVERYIKKNGYGKLIHSTGHSLGLSVHDGEVLNYRSNVVLKEGMVFTVEPGIYCPTMGGVRIEDDVLVCEDGIEVLTSAKKELEIE